MPSLPTSPPQGPRWLPLCPHSAGESTPDCSLCPAGPAPPHPSPTTAEVQGSRRRRGLRGDRGTETEGLGRTAPLPLWLQNAVSLSQILQIPGLAAEALGVSTAQLPLASRREESRGHRDTAVETSTKQAREHQPAHLRLEGVRGPGGSGAGGSSSQWRTWEGAAPGPQSHPKQTPR